MNAHSWRQCIKCIKCECILVYSRPENARALPRYAENAQALMLPAASSQGSRARRVHQDRPAHRRAGLTRSIRVDDSVAMARPRLPGVGCVCGTGQALTMIISALMAATAADGLLTQELTGPGGRGPRLVVGPTIL